MTIPTLRPALQPALLAALFVIPAWATVHLAGKDAVADARLEAAAHAEGLALKNVVGLRIHSAEGLDVASGTYLGLSRDKRTGYVLTAAHVLVKDAAPTPAERQAQVAITFGPRNDPDAVGTLATVRATRAIIHPKHRSVYDHTNRDSKGEPFPLRIQLNDLAILAFDAAGVRAQLEAKGIHGAPLYDGVGYTKPLIAARVAGFGLYGTSRSERLDETLKVHCGYTLTTYGRWRDRTAFLSWSPIPPEDEETVWSQDHLVNIYRFRAMPKLTVYRNPYDHSDIQVQTHDYQTLGAQGDSGGPLLFQSKGEIKVAGVLSQSIGDHLQSPRTQTLEFFQVQIMEPVMASLPWIREAMEDRFGHSLVLEFGAPAGAGRKDSQVASPEAGK
jgi:hypothetical protein